MSKELELWQFAASRLNKGEDVILLVVATSSGSSPGRAGYKMAVAADGELCGSIGGGLMEVKLVNRAKDSLSVPGAVATGDLSPASLIDQVHQKNSPDSSGMICSGRQTIIIKRLTENDANLVAAVVETLKAGSDAWLSISPEKFEVGPPKGGTQNTAFEKFSESDFIYAENLGPKNKLIIIGGGHCALALSELMSKLDFRILVLDDRPELNTIDKNQFADEITIIKSYESIADHITTGRDIYVVVMTLGYVSDELVIRSLFDRDFKYFGVLGSKAKMRTLLQTLENEGFDKDRLAHIRTPIGLPINSRTPEEIAVSIAAEIIAVKNS